MLPETTDSSSITRAFVLSFLSKLPPPEKLSDVVLKELVHHIILKLIDACCLPPAKGKPFITGSEEYSKMMRSWQALCLLSRFVTSDIADEVAQKVFQAMANLSHGQIRYFMEWYVKCSLSLVCLFISFCSPQNTHCFLLVAYSSASQFNAPENIHPFLDKSTSMKFDAMTYPSSTFHH